jgi:hypothetical protein
MEKLKEPRLSQPLIQRIIVCQRNPSRGKIGIRDRKVLREDIDGLWKEYRGWDSNDEDVLLRLEFCNGNEATQVSKLYSYSIFSTQTCSRY